MITKCPSICLGDDDSFERVCCLSSVGLKSGAMAKNHACDQQVLENCRKERFHYYNCLQSNERSLVVVHFLRVTDVLLLLVRTESSVGFLGTQRQME